MSTPVTAFDVAALVLSRVSPCTHMKLQKLLYYSQAWSLVWDEAPLFNETIEAWANGPVVPEIYSALRGRFEVSLHDLGGGDASRLTPIQLETVEAVLKFYQDKSSQWLSDLTHTESPWKDARIGISSGERGNREISWASMAEYYGSLT